jgi:hypothetical protein
MGAGKVRGDFKLSKKEFFRASISVNTVELALTKKGYPVIFIFGICDNPAYRLNMPIIPFFGARFFCGDVFGCDGPVLSTSVE